MVRRILDTLMQRKWILTQEERCLNGITSWLAEASREQKRTLVAASLGWMLDSMDVMLYALVLGEGAARDASFRGLERGHDVSHACLGSLWRPGLRMVCRPLWPRPRAHLEHPRLFRRYGHVRLDPFGLAVHGMPCSAGPRHGRGVGLRRGPRGRNLARPSSRQGAFPGAKFLGRGLRAGRRSGGACHAPLWMARRFLCRNRSWVDDLLVAARPCASRKPGNRIALRGSTWAGSFAARSAAACSSAPP